MEKRAKAEAKRARRVKRKQGDDTNDSRQPQYAERIDAEPSDAEPSDDESDTPDATN